MYGFGKKKIYRDNRKGVRRGSFNTRRQGSRGTWLAAHLNSRVQILIVVQNEATEGGFEQRYNSIKTVWSGIKPISHASQRRWSSIEGFGTVTHEFIFRYNAINDFHKEYGSGFGSGFDTVPNITGLTESMFLFYEKVSTTRGELFRVKRGFNNEEVDEYTVVLAEKIEEFGTGGNFLPDSSYIELVGGGILELISGGGLEFVEGSVLSEYIG